MSEDFASNLRRLMDKQDIGPSELADRMDVGRSTIHRWLHGDNIRQRSLQRLAEVLDATPDELMFSSDTLNEKKLFQTIETLEGAIVKKNISIKPKKKAKLIIHIYKRSEPNTLDAMVDEMLDIFA